MSNSESSSNEKGEYEVEAIMNDRMVHKLDKKSGKYKHIKEYLIKWVGYKRRSWEPIENLEGCKELLKNYISNKKNKLVKNNSCRTPFKFSSKKNKNLENNKNIYEQRGSPYLSDEGDDKSSLMRNYRTCINKKINNKKRLIKNKKQKEEKQKQNDKISQNEVIDVEEGYISPFSDRTKKGKNKKNGHESDSSDFMNLYEKTKNENIINKLKFEKKRKKNDSASDFSISIEDPFMKTENTSQINSNDFTNLNHKNEKTKKNTFNHTKSLGITKVRIPKNINDPIYICCKIEKNNKKKIVEETRNNINFVSKDEIIECYEKILKNYLGGKNVIFQ